MNAPLRATINTTILYCKLGLSTLIALVNIPLLLKALGVENYGIFSVVGGVIALLLFLNNTMTTATNRFLAVAEGKNDPQEKFELFNLCLVIHLAIAMVLLVVFEGIDLFAGDRILNIAPDRRFAAQVVFQTMVATTFISIATVPYTSIIIAKEKIFFFALTASLASLAKLGLTFLLFKVDSDRLIVYAVWLFVIHALERGAIVWFAHTQETIHYKFSHYDYGKIAKIGEFFGWSMTINFTLPAVVNGTSVLLNRFFGVIVNAGEGIAIQIAGQLSGFSSSLLTAVTPIIMKKEGASSPEKALDIALTSCKMSSYLILLGGLTIYTEMPFLLRVWLHEVPPFSVIFARLILWRVFFEQMTLSIAVLMNANGGIRRMQILTSAIHLLTLGAIYCLLHTGAQPYSAYIAMAVMMIVVGGVRIDCARRTYGLDPVVFLKDNVLRGTAVVGAGVLCMFGLCRILGEGWLRLGISVVSSIILLGIVIFVFGITANERAIFRSMWANLLGRFGISRPAQ